MCIFVPLLTYDERRIAAGRNFCICCIKHGSYDYHEAIQMIGLNRDEAMNNKTLDQEHNVEQLPANTTTMGHGKGVDVRSASQSVNDTEDMHQGDPKTTTNTTATELQTVTSTNSDETNNIFRFLSIEYLLIHTLVPILSKRVYRVIIYVIFGIFFILSILSLSSIDTETDLAKFVPDDSHIIDWLDSLHRGFGEIAFGTFDIVVENRDFSDEESRSDVIAMLDAFKTFDSRKGFISPDILEWVTDFDLWINDTLDVSVNQVEDMYYDLLIEFLNETNYKRWDDVIIFDDDENPTKIVATKV